MFFDPLCTLYCPNLCCSNWAERFGPSCVLQLQHLIELDVFWHTLCRMTSLLCTVFLVHSVYAVIEHNTVLTVCDVFWPSMWPILYLKFGPPFTSNFECQICHRMCRPWIGLFAHKKSHSWWWDPLYQRLSPWLYCHHHVIVYSYKKLVDKLQLLYRYSNYIEKVL